MKYVVMVGVNYKPVGQVVEKRAESGDVIDDWPKAELPWALDDGIIRKFDPTVDRSS